MDPYEIILQAGKLMAEVTKYKRVCKNKGDRSTYRRAIRLQNKLSQIISKQGNRENICLTFKRLTLAEGPQWTVYRGSKENVKLI